MGPTKLNMEEKTIVLALVREGLSNREIAKRTKRSEKSVRRVKIAANALGTGATPMRKKGTGRKRKTQTRTDKLLKREVQKDPFITARELKGLHADVLGDVAVRTIQERLQKDLKMPCRRAAHKPLMTERMRQQRLAFCRRYEQWTSEDWRSVVYSDESTFKTISKGQKNVRRTMGSDRYDSKTVLHAIGLSV
ncbi:hypothetical protein Pmani_023923 [Petrolisthes manimaculis]|uniref:Transposase Tc1-like domain-containing protein n=1 Tax=Petrolisthes manimaculis TaxID=1843537 RepID=A0AAE1P9S1_9EUCA|nr:hypothetical protein Pmani_023923 [Petrolisthes manimaculis]